MAKIVIDARELFATGTGTYLRHLLEGLQKIDKQNSYRILLKPQDMEKWTTTNKKFVKVECPYKEFTYSEQLDLLRLINKQKADLVHFAMVQQPVLYKGKTVTTMHDLTTTRFKNPAKNWLIFAFKQQVYKWVNKRVAHKTDMIITPTEYVKEDIAKFAHVNSRKITVTYESADLITGEPKAIEELKDKQFIMYVGRPQPHKNLDLLIEGFVDLKAQYPDLHLVLAGKRDILFRKLALKAKAKGVKDIIFTGFIEDAELKWLYQHTAAYVFPSLSEGFGLPGLEAMAHGAPVVSSSATCLPEVYGDAAEYFDPSSKLDLVRAVDEVLSNNKLRSKLITNGKKQASKYSWERMAQQTLEVYKQVLRD